MQLIFVCWSYILQIYQIHWLVLKYFNEVLRGFLYIRSCHLQTDNLTSSFLILLSFIFLAYCLWDLSTILNRSGESGHPYLVSVLRGKAFNFSPLSRVLAVDLLQVAFIMLKYVPSNLICGDFFFFIMKGCWILSNSFFPICWDDHMILSFIPLMWHLLICIFWTFLASQG